jgi:HEAT repeat protein
VTMEQTDDRVNAWIGLTSVDYGVRLITLGKLVEAGEASVPLLLEALKNPNPLLKACAACALAGIGSPRAARPLLALWEEEPSDPSRIEALTEFAGRLARVPRTEDIAALIELLTCYKNHSSYSTGREVAALAAEGLSKLARTAPSLPLREALPFLKRDIWGGSPDAFGEARALIEEATRQWKDLPVTASGPQTSATDLPRPADSD